MFKLIKWTPLDNQSLMENTSNWLNGLHRNPAMKKEENKKIKKATLRNSKNYVGDNIGRQHLLVSPNGKDTIKIGAS